MFCNLAKQWREKENIQCLSLIELDTFRQKTLKNQSAKIEVAPAGLARAN